ncbi:MAG TPA: hypothetical protein ENI38_04105, partial [Candidatus Acetothermia bacterium]|nr:hypothetical protein [Candidatus Acetothermia bacterium]
SGTSEVEGFSGTTYYYFPPWVPLLGMDITVVPLSVIEIRIPEMVTFASRNARFSLSASVYVRVINPLKAAQRWPGRTVDEFVTSVKELIQNAIRNTTTAFAAEDIIQKKEEIAAKLHEALAPDMDEYGCIITNVAVVNISDAPDTTVISDIARKREAEINSESRKVVAIKEKEARIVEADSRQEAETRRAAAEEAIGVREREKERPIFISQQQVAEEEMKVERVRKVRAAEIDRDAAIERAQGERQAAILRREGEAEGIKAVGMAEAEVIRQKGLAEAEAIAKRIQALNLLQAEGRIFREIEKEEKIGLELARALQRAQIRFVSTGEVTDFLKLFSATGGAKLGAMLAALRETDPEAANGLEKLIEALGKKGGG